MGVSQNSGTPIQTQIPYSGTSKTVPLILGNSQITRQAPMTLEPPHLDVWWPLLDVLWQDFQGPELMSGVVSIIRDMILMLRAFIWISSYKIRTNTFGDSHFPDFSW